MSPSRCSNLCVHGRKGGKEGGGEGRRGGEEEKEGREGGGRKVSKLTKNCKSDFVVTLVGSFKGPEDQTYCHIQCIILYLPKQLSVLGLDDAGPTCMMYSL